LYLAACAHSAAPQPDRAPGLDWMAGAWHADGFDARVVQVSGVTYMVSLRDDGFGVVMIEQHDVLALDNGRDPQKAQLGELGSDRVKLGPLVVARTGDHLKIATTDTTAARVEPAPVLEAADRAFAADSRARGAEAWLAVIAKDGALWRDKRVEGEDALREAVAHTLAQGTLTWEPSASGMRGDWGFTVGHYQLVPAGATAQAAIGTYCTIWKHDAGGWKVAFDLGS